MTLMVLTEPTGMDLADIQEAFCGTSTLATKPTPGLVVTRASLGSMPCSVDTSMDDDVMDEVIALIDAGKSDEARALEEKADEEFGPVTEADGSLTWTGCTINEGDVESKPLKFSASLAAIMGDPVDRLYEDSTFEMLDKGDHYEVIGFTQHCLMYFADGTCVDMFEFYGT